MAVTLQGRKPCLRRVYEPQAQNRCWKAKCEVTPRRVNQDWEGSSCSRKAVTTGKCGEDVSLDGVVRHFTMRTKNADWRLPHPPAQRAQRATVYHPLFLSYLTPKRSRTKSTGREEHSPRAGRAILDQANWKSAAAQRRGQETRAKRAAGSGDPCRAREGFISVSSYQAVTNSSFQGPPREPWPIS
jgi:hypothetical protein